MSQEWKPGSAASDQLFRKALEVSGYAVLITGSEIEAPGPVIRFANSAMAKLTGYAVEELIGADPRILQGPATDRAVLDDLKTALRNRRSFNGEAVNYRKDGSLYITDWMIDPVLDEEGNVQAWIAIQRDVTDRRQHRMDRQEGEERLRAIFSDASVGLSVIDREGRFLRVNPELCRILGRSEEEVLRIGIPEVTLPEDIPPSRLVVAEAVRSGKTAGLDKRYHRPDGTLVWANSSVTPLSDVQGRPGNLLVVTADLTKRKRAEQALRESDERFRQFSAASSDVLWIRNAVTLRFEYASPAFKHLYGLPVECVVGNGDLRSWGRLILPEDRRTALDMVRRARAGQHVTHEFRIKRPSDNQVRWVRDTAFAIPDADGRIYRIGGISEDATEAKENSDRLQVLIAELQHRTRNLMGVVRSMADKTARASTDLSDFRPRFRGRLDALARVQGLLSRLADVERITFDELIRSELLAMNGSAERVTLEGPEGIRLRSSTVQTLAMAVHELATNAVKYGALSQSKGRLIIAWSFEPPAPSGKPWLHIDWRESNVTMPPESESPRRAGQGRELIERALPYQLGAKTSYTFGRDGVRCTISVPVSDSTVLPEGSSRSITSGVAPFP